MQPQMPLGMLISILYNLSLDEAHLHLFGVTEIITVVCVRSPPDRCIGGTRPSTPPLLPSRLCG